jgi:hypothetical protein
LLTSTDDLLAAGHSTAQALMISGGSMTPAKATKRDGQFALVTCIEARPGDGHPVIGQNMPFDSWGKALVNAQISIGLYRRILEASRMGWWQFWYRVETTETTEKHVIDDAGRTLEVHTWRVASNRPDMPIYRVVLGLGHEPMRANFDVDPRSDLQTVFRSIEAMPSPS